MSNINTFFDNVPLNEKLRQNTKEETDNNDVLIMDDIDDFGRSFSNINDIKNLNSEKIHENLELKKQGENDIDSTSLQKIDKIKAENLNEKKIPNKNIPIINSESTNNRNLNSNIDNLFYNFKNSSLFSSNMNLITMNNLPNSKIDKESVPIESEQKLNNINLHDGNKNFNSNRNNFSNVNNNLNTNANLNGIHFERNTKLRNNALNSNPNSTKELINLMTKPVNSLDNKHINNNNANNFSNKYEFENTKNFSSNTNTLNTIQNSNNSRYPDLKARQNFNNGRTLDNNSSINMNSAKNKSLNGYNNNANLSNNLNNLNNPSNSNSFNNSNTNTISSTDSYRDQIFNFNNNANSNKSEKNRISDSDQVNYDKTQNSIFSLQKPQQEFYSVKDFASREEMNPKYKNNMEDYVKIIDRFNGNPKMGLFSLYDGHGGEDPVKYVKDRMPEILAKFIKNSNDSIDNCLKSAFEKIDNELKFYDSENTGTTATVVVINGKYLYLANVGDSKCIIATSLSNNKNNIEIKKISYDHKCGDEAEAERIKNSGGMIFNNRVFGQLALTRALGDHAIKKYGVISDPHVTKFEIKQSDKFIIICSDGVWDVTSDDDLKAILIKSNNCAEIVDAITQHSLIKGSKDNISCVAFRL